MDVWYRRHFTATDDSPFFDNDMPTMRSSSSSSDGLPHVTGLNWEGSVESNEVSAAIETASVIRSDTDVVVTLCLPLPGFRPGQEKQLSQNE